MMRGCQSTMAPWRGVEVLVVNFEVSLNTVHVLIRGVSVSLPGCPVRRLYFSMGECWTSTAVWPLSSLSRCSRFTQLPKYWNLCNVVYWRRRIYLEKGFASWSLGSVVGFCVAVMNDRHRSVTFCNHLSSITCQRQTPCFEVISGNLHPPSKSHGCVQITACFTLVLQNGKMFGRIQSVLQ